jgi:hypothetical protein
MTNFKIVIPGEAPVKKNNRKESYTRVDKKTGERVALSFPISWYTPTYNEWAGSMVQRLIKWKRSNPERLNFPLKGQYVCTMLFFYKTHLYLEHKEQKGKGDGTTLDLSNLYDSILDTLAGNSGLTFPKKANIFHEDYRIIADDSVAYIKNHGASYVFQDYGNPRTEIFISDFKLSHIADIMKLCHPGLEVGYIPEPDIQPQVSMFPLTTLEEYLKL